MKALVFIVLDRIFAKNLVANEWVACHPSLYVSLKKGWALDPSGLTGILGSIKNGFVPTYRAE